MEKFWTWLLTRILKDYIGFEDVHAYQNNDTHSTTGDTVSETCNESDDDCEYQGTRLPDIEYTFQNKGTDSTADDGNLYKDEDNFDKHMQNIPETEDPGEDNNIHNAAPTVDTGKDEHYTPNSDNMHTIGNIDDADQSQGIQVTQESSTEVTLPEASCSKTHVDKLNMDELFSSDIISDFDFDDLKTFQDTPLNNETQTSLDNGNIPKNTTIGKTVGVMRYFY